MEGVEPTLSTVKFKTTPAPQGCVLGWPRTDVGYPNNCDTKIGADGLPYVEPKMYEYCSPPAPFLITDISGIRDRHLYRMNVPKPRGVHSYYNMMWDGRVRRGDPAQRKARREDEECAKIMDRLNRPRKTKSMAQRVAEMKAKAEKAKEEEDLLQTEMFRQENLALANLVPKDPWKYLHDLSDEVDVLDPCYKGKLLPPLREFPVAPSRAPDLEDIGTQVTPTDLFDFEGDCQPVLERLLGAVLDEAQFELLEEMELRALLDQQYRHKELIQKTKDNIARWEERDRVREEERLRQAEQQALRDCKYDEAVCYYRVCAFSGTLTKNAVNECIIDLMDEGYLMKEMWLLMQKVFVPWVNDKVEKEVKIRDLSRTMLNWMIGEVVDQREAEYAESIWRDVYEVTHPIKRFIDRQGSAPPPPTPGTSPNESEGETEAEGNISDFA